MHDSEICTTIIFACLLCKHVIFKVKNNRNPSNLFMAYAKKFFVVENVL